MITTLRMHEVERVGAPPGIGGDADSPVANY
jgi:hypothetical protein